MNKIPKLPKSPNIPKTLWKNPIHFIACGFGVGALPLMPGTFATAFAVPLVILLDHLPTISQAVIILLMNLAGVWLCGKTNRDFGTDDHPAAVWDEIAAFPIVFFGVPINWKTLLIGFILFRCFDILKPGPIGWVDKHIHGGIGVMLDDILAALASLAFLQIIRTVLGLS